MIAVSGNDQGRPAAPRHIHEKEGEVPHLGGSAAATHGVLKRMRALSNRARRSSTTGSARAPEVTSLGAGLARAALEQIFEGNGEDEDGRAASLRVRPVASVTIAAEDWELREGNATNSSGGAGEGGGGGCPTRRGLRAFRRNGTDAGNGTAGGNGTRSCLAIFCSLR